MDNIFHNDFARDLTSLLWSLILIITHCNTVPYRLTPALTCTPQCHLLPHDARGDSREAGNMLPGLPGLGLSEAIRDF